jgi:hypothetical protein
LQAAGGFSLGIRLIPHGIFLRIRPARPDLVVVLKHGTRGRPVIFGYSVHHKTAFAGEFPDIRFRREALLSRASLQNSA